MEWKGRQICNNQKSKMEEKLFVPLFWGIHGKEVTMNRIPVLLNLGFVAPCIDRLCGLVVRVSGYRYRGPGFDSWLYQIFWVVVGLERGPLSLVRSIEELLE